jgi:protein-S-isoprenylcysteine O-methyltransferase Ste14
MFWLILSVLIWGALHSTLASLKAKELAHRWFGPAADRFYRLAYNLFALASFGPVLVIIFLTPDRQLYLVPLPWMALMIAGQLLAMVALVVGFLQMDVWEFVGLRQTTGSLSSRGGELLISGLYRHVRHPLYTAGLAFIWLMPLMTANVLAINIALSLYVVIGAWFEERKLMHEFGEAYAAYQRQTPMLVPFLRFRRNK